jgi:hypothetical protein
MSSTQWLVYLLFIVIGAFLSASFIEVYKKTIRKDKHKKWECWLIGGAISVLYIFFLKFSGVFYPMMNTLFGAKLWLDYGIHIIIFYFLQFNMDMHIVKKLIKSLVTQWLKSNIGMDDEQIEYLLAEFKTNKEESKETEEK